VGGVSWVDSGEDEFIDNEVRRDLKSRGGQPWEVDYSRRILGCDETRAGGEDLDFILVRLA